MIGEKELAKMKKSAILINTARGRIVDEAALIKALREKQILGAGLDVFEKEPLPLDNPLIKLENVVLTPHIGFVTQEALEKSISICVNNIEKYVDGKPHNVVNPEAIASFRLP
jgi:D-3-phosphoglycerate dehydrogenase